MIRLADIEATFRKSGPQGAPPPSAGVPTPHRPGLAPPPPSTAEWHEQRARHQEMVEAARRKAQKPVSLDVPPGLGDESPELARLVKQYNEAREAEKRLDAIMMRKRLEIWDTVPTSSPPHGTLRLWISNTVENQPWQATAMDHDTFDFSSNVEATFRVKIDGRLKPDSMDAEDDELASNSDKKWSHFFKAVTVDFHRHPDLQPDQYAAVHWEKQDLPPQALADTKGGEFTQLSFQRKGDENINVTINLTRDYKPERYKLAPQLAAVLDTEEADRQSVLSMIWTYCQAYGLMEEGESRMVRCDTPLAKALGVDHFQFPQLTQIIHGLMWDLPPIQLQYTIRVDKDFHSNNPQPTAYDIRVPLDDPVKAHMAKIRESAKHTPTLRKIARTNDEIALCMQALAHEKAKADFFNAMALDPANFTKRWISSQKRDLDIILGAGAWGEEDLQNAEWRKGGARGPWGSDEAWEGIGTYLSRQDRAARTTG